MAERRLRRGASRVLALVALLGGALLAPASAQGKLERVREAVRDGDHDGDHDSDPHHIGDDDDWLWFGDGDEGDPIGPVIAWTVLAPFAIPRRVLGDSGGRGQFLEYPYREGPGYWRFFDPASLDRTRPWSLRPRAEVGTDFDDLERFGLGLEIEHASRFGLDASWNRWREDLVGGGTDRIDLGDFNLVYRFAQSQSTAFRAGIGLNVLDDDVSSDSDFGFNTTYGVEFFPARPLTGGLEFDLGTLGDATQFHFRSELGFVLERFGLFGTFDYFEIDDVVLRSFGVGLRGWM